MEDESSDNYFLHRVNYNTDESNNPSYTPLTNELMLLDTEYTIFN